MSRPDKIRANVATAVGFGLLWLGWSASGTVTKLVNEACHDRRCSGAYTALQTLDFFVLAGAICLPIVMCMLGRQRA